MNEVNVNFGKKVGGALGDEICDSYYLIGRVLLLKC